MDIKKKLVAFLDAFLNFLDMFFIGGFGIGMMIFLTIAGGLLFLSGFRFLSLLDTATRLVLGGGCFVVCGLYLWREYRLWCLRRYKRRRYFRP